MKLAFDKRKRQKFNQTQANQRQERLKLELRATSRETMLVTVLLEVLTLHVEFRCDCLRAGFVPRDASDVLAVHRALHVGQLEPRLRNARLRGLRAALRCEEGTLSGLSSDVR